MPIWTDAAMDTTPRPILSIDDNEVDGALLSRAVKRTGVPWRLFTVTEGSQALSYLGGEGIYGDRTVYPLPEIILLDIRMPKMSGMDVLRWIRDRTELKKIPIVVLTSSTHPEDKTAAHKAGVIGYYNKPNRFQELQEIVRSIHTEHVEKAKRTKTAKPKVELPVHRRERGDIQTASRDGIGSAASERASKVGVSPTPEPAEVVRESGLEAVGASV
jgi:CheY-like chemotaxis protein